MLGFPDSKHVHSIDLADSATQAKWTRLDVSFQSCYYWRRDVASAVCVTLMAMSRLPSGWADLCQRSNDDACRAPSAASSVYKEGRAHLISSHTNPSHRTTSTIAPHHKTARESMAGPGGRRGDRGRGHRGQARRYRAASPHRSSSFVSSPSS
jgi:hypothetical protein